MPDWVNGYVDGKDLVLCRREADGRLTFHRRPAQFAAFAPRDRTSPELRRLLEKAATSVVVEGSWLRVLFPDDLTRRNVCFHKESRRDRRDPETGKPFENPWLAAGFQHHEADLDPVTRHMVDSGDGVQRPRRAYLDLETDSRLPFSKKEQMRILTWALVDAERTVQAGVLQAFDDRAERELLMALWEALAPYDQVAAWNGDGFDFPVWAARAEHCDAPMDMRRLLLIDHMLAFKRMNMHSAESGEEKRSMALQSIAMATLGRGKVPFDASKTYEAWAAGGQSRRDLLRYNVEDALLMPAIEEKKGYLGQLDGLCQTCRVFGDSRALNPTRQMDGFLLSLAAGRDRHFPSRQYGDDSSEEGDEPGPERKQFRGALVLQPKTLDPAWRAKMGMQTGILRDVHVCDFSGMYPSIISTFNMSFETKAVIQVNGPVPAGHCRLPTTGVGFRTDVVGLLVEAVDVLVAQRKKHNDLKATFPPGTEEWLRADSLATSGKVIPNSFYGGVGSQYSRFEDVQIAEGITQTGVWLISRVIGECERRGWQVAYADTDSAMCVGPTAAEFKEFVAWCNAELFPEMLRKQGCVRNEVKLAYEKQFDILVFTSAKRYFGNFVHYKGKAATKDSKPEIKGLEFKRGDVSLLGAHLQEKVVKTILAGRLDAGSFHDLLVEARRHVLEDALPLEEVQLSKSVTKSIGKHDAKTGKWKASEEGYAQKNKVDGTEAKMPAHVAVARVLALRGREVGEGTRVNYFTLDDEADDPAKRHAPAEDYAGECDRHHLWESLVYPPSQRLLEAAFPAQADHWKAWERSRPPKARARRAAPQAAGELFASMPDVASPKARPIPDRPR